jgi:hypothetical protein
MADADDQKAIELNRINPSALARRVTQCMKVHAPTSSIQVGLSKEFEFRSELSMHTSF